MKHPVFNLEVEYMTEAQARDFRKWIKAETSNFPDKYTPQEHEHMAKRMAEIDVRFPVLN